MKKILMATVLAVMGGAAYATDFAELNGLKSGEVSGVMKNVKTPAPANIEEFNIVTVEGVRLAVPMNSIGQYRQYLQKLKFTTVLEGKQITVSIVGGKEYTYLSGGRIVIDGVEFYREEQGKNGYNGARKRVKEGVMVVDQSVAILSLEEAPLSGISPALLQDASAVAKKFGYSNWEEIKCSKGDMLMTIDDSLTSKGVGNCITPVGE
jgi:hypothetical protein